MCVGGGEERVFTGCFLATAPEKTHTRSTDIFAETESEITTETVTHGGTQIRKCTQKQAQRHGDTRDTRDTETQETR